MPSFSSSRVERTLAALTVAVTFRIGAVERPGRSLPTRLRPRGRGPTTTGQGHSQSPPASFAERAKAQCSDDPSVMLEGANGVLAPIRHYLLGHERIRVSSFVRLLDIEEAPPLRIARIGVHVLRVGKSEPAQEQPRRLDGLRQRRPVLDVTSNSGGVTEGRGMIAGARLPRAPRRRHCGRWRPWLRAARHGTLPASRRDRVVVRRAVARMRAEQDAPLGGFLRHQRVQLLGFIGIERRGEREAWRSPACPRSRRAAPPRPALPACPTASARP